MEDNEGGRRLRHLREAKGWTRAELAERSGIAESSISNYELGKTSPESAKLLPIAEAFNGKDGVWLLEGFGFEEDARLMATRHDSNVPDAWEVMKKFMDEWSQRQ